MPESIRNLASIDSRRLSSSRFEVSTSVHSRIIISLLPPVIGRDIAASVKRAGSSLISLTLSSST